MKLSIIVPVYNVESSIDNCIKSIMMQDVDDWELLLIDDGSPDRCPEICDGWARTDSRIKVHHKKNGGLSDARNYGIAHAVGDYITFIDSDDELAPDTLRPLMKKLCETPECDILEYSALIHEGAPNCSLLTLPDKQWQSAKDYWLQSEGWTHCYAWNKIYHKRIFEKHSFPKGRVFEDAWLWPEILSGNPMVVTTSHGRYIYKWNEKGITVNVSPHGSMQHCTSLIRAAVLMRTSPFSTNAMSLYKNMVYRFCDIFILLFK